MHEHLIPRPAATHFIRIGTRDLQDAGILRDDVAVIDKSLHAKSGDIVLGVIDGEFTFGRFKKAQGRIYLCTECDENRIPRDVSECDFQIWGVVTSIFRKMA